MARPFPALAALLSLLALALYVASVSSCHWLSYEVPNSQTYLGPFRACTRQQTLGIDESNYVSNRCNADFSPPIGVVSVTNNCNSLRAVRAFLIISIVLTAIATLSYYLSSFERVPVLVPRTHGMLWSLLAGGSGIIAWAIFIHVANVLGDPWVYSWGFAFATASWVLNWLSLGFAYIRYPYYEEERKLGSRFDTGIGLPHHRHAGETYGESQRRTHPTGTHEAERTGVMGTGAAAGASVVGSIKHALGFGKPEHHQPASYGKHYPEEPMHSREREREHERMQHAREEERVPYSGEQRTGTGTYTVGEQATPATGYESQRFAPSTSSGGLGTTTTGTSGTHRYPTSGTTEPTYTTASSGSMGTTQPYTTHYEPAASRAEAGSGTEYARRENY